jgi:DNA (cytosine-5)-methyltransferase 1
MENVQGLLSAKVNGEKVFDWMKKDLQLKGKYSIHSFIKPVEEDKDFLIKAEDFGIPQKRHRVILLGVRKDFNVPTSYLKKTNQVPLVDIIGKMPAIRSGLNRTFVDYDKTELYLNGNPKRLYENLNDSSEAWSKTMSDQIKKLKKWGDLELNGLSNGPTTHIRGIGSEFESAENTMNSNHPLYNWYIDSNLKGLPNHESRAHLTQDLMRYMFAGLYVEKKGTFPRLEDYAAHHEDLIPDHANVESGKFSDRFRVQLADRPATTITSHISKDGHYFIHYDPKQCRSLTVREAARIQTFPDNYLFRGSRTQQFHQVGNAVPPFLARQLGQIVYQIFNSPHG